MLSAVAEGKFNCPGKAFCQPTLAGKRPLHLFSMTGCVTWVPQLFTGACIQTEFVLAAFALSSYSCNILSRESMK